MNESWHIRISHRTYEWVSTRMNKSRHIWMSDVLYRHVTSRINTSRRYCADLVISACLPAHRNIQEKHIWMSHFNRSVALPSCWQPWYTSIALIIRHILFIFINKDVRFLHTHITYTGNSGNPGALVRHWAHLHLPLRVSYSSPAIIQNIWYHQNTEVAVRWRSVAS